eukprot:GHVT01033522.1.p1 GENE.GHVT01033522.1~~GHVT01033522.1.p1  ORF type:complete len:429 (+),score=63.87 GHVT01033522.1:1462-2748(+)
MYSGGFYSVSTVELISSGFFPAVDSYPCLFVRVFRFSGPPRKPEEYKTTYEVDGYHYFTPSNSFDANMKQALEALACGSNYEVWLLSGKNSDSGITLAAPAGHDWGAVAVDDKILYEVMAECRAVKTPAEVAYLSAACLASSQAHVYAMRQVGPGQLEVHAEGFFRAFCTTAGASRAVAYDCICGGGWHSSILHYGHAGRPNDARLAEGAIFLCDMGGEFDGYATDITLSYPVGRPFSEKQRLVYSAVREAQVAVENSMKEGTLWTDMHRLAEISILKILQSGGLLSAEASQEELVDSGLGSVFMPHGLGHLMGMDTHDVGGFTASEPPATAPGLRYLRTTRKLKAGMVITVEPGCYFVDYLLDSCKHDEKKNRLIAWCRMDKFRGFGGIRLEDDVVVTTDGIVNLTVVPRALEDMEEILEGMWGRKA